MANTVKLGQYFCVMWNNIFLKVMNAVSLFSQRYISMEDDVSHFFAVYKSTSTWLVFICYIFFFPVFIKTVSA